MPEIESEAMSFDARHFIPLARAYLCQDCDSVGSNSMRCPSCASRALMGLAGVFDRKEEVKELNLLQFPSLAA
jgi:primosomal protein N'